MSDPDYTTPRLCLVPGCCNSRRTRGLCHSHYQTAQRMRRAGTATEADLVRRGLMTKDGKGGGTPTIRFDGFKIGSKVRGGEHK